MLSEILFNKPLEQVSREDLKSFFSVPRKESDKVEFKSYKDFPDANKTKKQRDKEKVYTIIKTICAFLNTDGGLLIWGAPEEKRIEGEKGEYAIGELTSVTYNVSKDALLSTIYDAINPTPVRIKCHSISITEEEYYYLFDIEPSSFSPHQYQGTYYMRLDGATRPAPHQYVEALIRKISFPRLEAFVTFGSITDFNDYAGMPIQITINNLSSFQNEKNVYYRLLSIGGDVVPFALDDIGPLKYHTNFSELARDVLHCKMPFYQYFMFLTRNPRYSKLSKVTISLIVWGEASPAIQSKYDLEFLAGGNLEPCYRLVGRNENVYLVDDTSPAFSNDSIDSLKNYLLKEFEKNIFEQKLFKNLYSR